MYVRKLGHRTYDQAMEHKYHYNHDDLINNYELVRTDPMSLNHVGKLNLLTVFYTVNLRLRKRCRIHVRRKTVVLDCG